MPQSLKDTYDGILMNLSEEKLALVHRALVWLCFSARPVTLLELAEAVSIDNSKDEFDPKKDRIWDPAIVTKLCPSLIDTTVLPSSVESWMMEKNSTERKWRIGSPETIVTLAHYTVKEYIMTERLHAGGAANLYVPATLGHAALAEACIVYVLSANEGRIMKQLDETDFASHPLLAYATRYWIEHYQAVDSKQHLDRSRSLVTRLFDPSNLNALVNWLNVNNPDGQEWQTTRHRPVDTKRSAEGFPRPLYYSAYLGDAEVLERQLQITPDINTSEGKLGSVLAVASYHGNAEMVQLLLARGADPNLKGGAYGYPLQAAAVSGCEKTVKILLDAGAQVNGAGGEYHTALIAAASKEHRKIVSLLLKNGADLDIGGERHGKALRVAGASGNANQVLLLLAAGADINDTNEGEGTALYAAAEAGSQHVVQLLLRKGADVNLLSGPCGTALQAASSQGHAHILRILLKAGADVNIWGSRYDDPLQAVVESHNMESFHLLLEAGVRAGHTAAMYEHAMHAAVQVRNLLAATELLELGTPFGDEEFLEAIEMEEPPLVQAMLEAGADIDAHAGEKGSALIKAIASGNEDLVWLLLSYNPDIHARGEGGEALNYAAGRKKFYRVAEELLNRGALVDGVRGSLNCPLEAACRAKDRPMIELLLAKGADVNVPCSQYGTP